MIFQSMTAVVGLLIALYAGPPGVRYFGLFLAVYGTQSNVPTTLAYAQSQTATIEKKGVLAAAMISVGCIGGIMGSTIFRSQDAPVSSCLLLERLCILMIAIAILPWNVGNNRHAIVVHRDYSSHLSLLQVAKPSCRRR